MKSRSRSRSRSADRSRRHHQRHRRSASPDHRKPRRRDDEAEKDRQGSGSAVAAEKRAAAAGTDVLPDDLAAGGMDSDEAEMMKKLGIPLGFDSTKGKPVPDANMSGIRAVTKRQPRQYMNRRGGFNRPLPAERNR